MTARRNVDKAAVRSSALMAVIWMGFWGLSYARCQAQAAGAESSANSWKILMLFSEAKDVPGNVMVEQAARAELSKSTTNQIEFFSEHLDARRFPDQNHYRLFRDHLRDKYADRKLDLVMAFTGRSFTLAGDLPAAVFPNLPVVFIAVNEQPVPPELNRRKVTGVVERLDVQGTLELMLRLQPETHRVVVIGGASESDRATLSRVEDEARRLSHRLEFEFLTNRPVTELPALVAALPEGTVLLLSAIQYDVAGVTYNQSQAAQLLAASANVPMYVMGGSAVGSGAVGGMVADPLTLGARAGRLASEILSGVPVYTLPIEMRTNGAPVVDWRALKRWDLSASKLPAGSAVRFRPTTLWEAHKQLLLGSLAVFLAQAATISGLLIQRLRRKQAEEAQVRLATIVETSEDAIISRDLAGRVVTWNHGAAELFQYRAEEAVGRPIKFIIPAEYEDEEEKMIQRLRSGERAQHYETVRARKDGTMVEVSVNNSLIRDWRGAVIGASTVVRDISGRKQAESEIARQRAELEHVARVSTLGQLASALAHELTQPLGAILRNTEAAELFLQRETPDLTEIRAILADIRKDDQRAGGVIERMRSLLKRRSLGTAPLDLSELLEETLALIRPDATARQVRCELKAPVMLPKVLGDRIQLQQVLLNLILNGMDAMAGCAKGERRLVVRVKAVEAGGAQVAVCDCGMGIQSEKIEQVFQPFFTTKSHGMGMGLALSRTIIEAHGGRIWAENNPTRGATFRFVLPGMPVSAKLESEKGLGKPELSPGHA